MLPAVRMPVRRRGAADYLLLLLLSFAAAVVLTRWYLALTGYPQIGAGELHFAHVLWGGLLLFVAILLVLIWANHWTYTAAALFGGAGAGLFMDEVGKFITRSNDYFFAPAAPIIYAVFLLMVLVYLRVRRHSRPDARTALYQTFDALGEALDRNLDPRERGDLANRLRPVSMQTVRPDLANLATHLLQFLATESVLAPPAPRRWQRWRIRLLLWEDRWVPRRLLRGLLWCGLAAVGLEALLEGASVLLAVNAPTVLRGLAPDLAATPGHWPAEWDLLRLTLVLVLGVWLAGSGLLVLAGQEARGFAWSAYALLFSLTVVNLVAFYFDQFATVAALLGQFVLFLGVRHYLARYLA